MYNNFKNYLLMEVAHQGKIKSVNISDDGSHYGYEPQSTLELKEPGRWSLESLAATLHGEAALHPFKEGDLVAVCLKTSTRMKNGEYMNHIDIEDIKLVKQLEHLFL